MRTTRRPALEPLEDRTLLSTVSVPWPSAAALTISFAPDGASALDAGSDLFKTLNAKAATNAWETEILKGFRDWAAKANVNLALVYDDGSAFGAPGAPQGDTRFGDIRIGAAHLGATAVATAQPFNFSGTTWSGDVLFNSDMDFSVAGGPGKYDLFTVAMHEAGHSFGLDDSTDPTSAMYESFQGARTGLSSGDVANIQALYGPRPWLSPNLAPLTTTPVQSVGTLALNLTAPIVGLLNNTPALATPLVFTPTSTPVPQWDAIASSGLQSWNQANYWKVLTPASDATGPFTLTAMAWQATGSQVLTKIEVFDAKLNPLAVQVAANDHGAFTVQLPNLQLGGATYYLKVSPLRPTEGQAAGSYILFTNIHQGGPLSLQSVASDTLGPSNVRQDRTLTNNQDQLYHFSLAAQSATTAPTEEIQMQIFDAAGNLVFALTARAGEPPASGTVYLTAGTYTVRFTAVAKSGAVTDPISFNLSDEVISDPIGPQPTSPTSGSGGSTTSQPPIRRNVVRRFHDGQEFDDADEPADLQLTRGRRSGPQSSGIGQKYTHGLPHPRVV